MQHVPDPRLLRLQDPVSELPTAGTSQLADEAAIEVGFASDRLTFGEQVSLHAHPPDHQGAEPVFQIAAHELRTPLHAMLLALDLLGAEIRAPTIDPEQAEKMVETLRRQIIRLEQQVENVLLTAELLGGRARLNPQPVNLRSLLEEIQPVVAPLLARREQKLRIRLPSSLPPIRADSWRIGQVLLNLLSNAGKYADAGAIVDVWAAARPKRSQSVDAAVRVAVADRGPGIAVADRARLFEPFTRGRNVDGGPIPGMGLGLAVVNGIVRAHGGRVGVRGRPGGGAIFWFELPAA